MDIKLQNELIKKIQQKYSCFSKGQKGIAKFIIEHYEKAAFMTAAKIGETVNVSESTVVRFASALEYKGFPEFQKALQFMIKNNLTTVQRMSLDENDTINITLQKFLKKEISSLKDFYENIDSQAFENASNLIIEAKKIYIIGMRVSHSIAEYLGFYLDIIHENVKVLNLGINSVYEQMIRINEDDLLIIISFPRYSKQSLDIASFAKEREAKILAITDTEESPFYSVADAALLGKSNIVSFMDSLITPMAIINSLIISVSMKEKNNIVKYFDLLEDIWDKYSIYKKPIITEE